MSSKSFKRNGSKRDSGVFVLFTHDVVDSAAYRQLGFASRALLVDLARQYTGTNNGRIVACNKYLKPLGWNSHATVTKSLRELQDSGLLVQTRLGMRPNRAAWFALAWYQLDASQGIEMTNKEYLDVKSDWKRKNIVAPLIPKTGIGTPRIAPINGLSSMQLAPLNGVMQ